MKICLLGDSIAKDLFDRPLALPMLTNGGRVVESLADAEDTSAEQLATWLASSQRGDPSVDCALIASLGIYDVMAGIDHLETIANLEAIRADMRASNPGMKIVYSLMLPARGQFQVAARYFTHYRPIIAAMRIAKVRSVDPWDCIETTATAVADNGFGALAGAVWGGLMDPVLPAETGNREHGKYLRRAVDDALGLLSCDFLDHPTRAALPGWRDSLGATTNNGHAIVSGHRCPACP